MIDGDVVGRQVIDLQRQLNKLRNKRRSVEQAILALEHLAREYKTRNAGSLRNRWIFAGQEHQGRAGNIVARLGKAV